MARFTSKAAIAAHRAHQASASCAGSLAAQAPWLVTGDDDLLSVPAIDGLSIVTPAQGLLSIGT